MYAAIRQAAPGGLGRAAAQDVTDEPTMTLLGVMQLAADRDGIAREYATAFEVTFGTGAPALDWARRDGLCWNEAKREAPWQFGSGRPAIKNATNDLRGPKYVVRLVPDRWSAYPQL